MKENQKPGKKKTYFETERNNSIWEGGMLLLRT